MKRIMMITLLGVLAIGLMGCTKPAPAPVETADETERTDTGTGIGLDDLDTDAITGAISDALDTESLEDAMEEMLSMTDDERMAAFREQAEAEISLENAQSELDRILAEMAGETE